MPSAPHNAPPPDQAERERALNAARSVLVRAPAGSGKTDLLTRRFLRLLGKVDAPGQILAITFTKAAAAEMRQRILAELEKAAQTAGEEDGDSTSMPALARRALTHSQALGWKLLELPAQLRISTIDSFCRELALQQPLLTGLGGTLEIGEQPNELYRRAARRTIAHIEDGDDTLREAIAVLLLWRDNSWQDLENQLVAMLAQRDRWMHGFVLDRDPDWEALHEQLERPFVREGQEKLAALDALFDQLPGGHEEAHALVRFGCEQSDGRLYREFAEMVEPPSAPFSTTEELEDARRAYLCLADLLLTGDGVFRRQFNVGNGFPKERKAEKSRALALIAGLRAVSSFESALADVRNLPPARYSEEDWAIVRACFTLLRHAAAELRVVFAEANATDYIEVAQIALHVLRGEDELPTEAALAAADGIHHLLVDEFQDTSRRQHQLLARLVAAWPEREGRTCFAVGDPMQSIYFFRGADAELFPRVESLGLEIPGDQPLRFDAVQLRANFRTAPVLVESANQSFEKIFAVNDGSGLRFTAAIAARDASAPAADETTPPLALHLEFMPQTPRGNAHNPGEKEQIAAARETSRQKQIEEIVALIRDRQPQIEAARETGKKFRIAVIGRARRSLAPIALALHQAGIPFRAIELEELGQRPEIVDALALARALFNPQNRAAWLGLLRAPWCGLSLADLYALAGNDEAERLARPIPDLLTERIERLSPDGRKVAARLLHAIESAARLRSAQPTAALGTWLEEIWHMLGGAECVDETARANLDLLWASLDALPDGEPDLLGPALDSMLNDLKAQPDPAADSDCGVQLMTMHGAKGLEFEIVIVPELEARPGRGRIEMLSWLERGLPPEEEEAGEVTEFLVAPVQSKGAERGAAKRWVDRVRHEREKQETRRLLYVAATRAREELHLFARPAYRQTKDGELTLVEPGESLLATAWPAWEEEIRRRFDAWRETATEAEPAIIETLAASAANNLVEIYRPTLLRRLPADYESPREEFAVEFSTESLAGAGRLYERHEGGVLSRALGKAVHLLLEELAHLRESSDWEQTKAALTPWEARIVAQLRAAGVPPARAGRVAAQAIAIALDAATDSVGQWILSPHVEAFSEARWSAVIGGTLHTVQADRVFRAGSAPETTTSEKDEESWWIVDYKTAHEDDLDPAVALPELRKIFAPQVETYAAVLRNLNGEQARIRGGLYYPRMKQFDWWEL
jgi:ATP-dependent exoDNAse (exonuclease V) beta subunit